MFALLKKTKICEWILLILCVALIVGQIYFEMALPESMGKLIVQSQMPSFSTEMLWSAALRLLIYAMASFCLMLLCSCLTAQMASSMGRSLCSELFSKVVGFGKEEMDRYSIPDLVMRTTGDVWHVQAFWSIAFQIVVKAPILSIWAAAKIIRVSWEMSAVTAGFLFCLLLWMFVSFQLLLPRFRKMRRALEDIETIAETASRQRRKDDGESRRAEFQRADEVFSQAQFSGQRISSAMLPAATLGMSGLTLSVFWLGAFLIERIPGRAGRLSMFGDMIVFGNYACMIMLSIMMLAAVFSLIPAARVSAGRIVKVLNMDVSVQSGTRMRGSQRGTLEFKDVSFRYPNADHDALSHVSFKISRGETAIFIGDADSGKTTLAHLAARIYDADEGQILLDGIDIREYSLDTLYDALSCVMQTPTLFDGTVEEAVNFGKSDAVKSEEHTWQALTLAAANEFVEKLPHGLRQNIGPDCISESQQRRLTLARALARRPEILILDDTFSDMDDRTRTALHANLEEELRGTTQILFAHRPDAQFRADRVFVLRGGHLEEQTPEAPANRRERRGSLNFSPSLAVRQEGDAHA